MNHKSGCNKKLYITQRTGSWHYILAYIHLAEENVQPVVGNSGHGGVAFLQCLAFQESFKHRRLEYLDEMQLSTPLHLKTLHTQKPPFHVETFDS